MKAVVTVLGSDRPGIIATVSTALYKCNANILDISQTIMQGIFTMLMLTDLSESGKTVNALEEELKALAERVGVTITVQHEEIFHSMHRI